ncbi:MAG: chorismate mutase [Fervidobacterium sp.]
MPIILMNSNYKIVCIRGATSLESDDPAEVREKVLELWNELNVQNDIVRIISVIFSVTPDIVSFNPATALRENLMLEDVALMCLQEAVFENSPQRIIRILIICEGGTQNFVYLHGAKDLRTKK